MEVKLDISFFEVVIVDFDVSVQLVILCVNNPLGLPLTSPACLQLEVDAGDIDLEVSVLVEAKGCSGGSVAILQGDVFVDRGLDSVPNQITQLRRQKCGKTYLYDNHCSSSCSGKSLSVP